jgi:hypothetical protein
MDTRLLKMFDFIEVLGQSTSMQSVPPLAEMMSLIAGVVPVAVGGLLALSVLFVAALAIVLSRRALRLLKT